MLNRIARILMNEADASPGGGAPASTPPTPDAQAKEPAAAPAITLEAIAELLERQKNSVEANTRRMIEGALGKKKGGNSPAPDKDAAPGAAPTQPQTVDMRAFDRATRRLDLSDSALARMERAYAAEAPDDAAEWVKSYVEDLGIKSVSEKPAVTPSGPATATATPAAPPAAATPAPSTHVPGDGPDQVRKWDEHQVRAYLGKNGGDAANPLSWRNRKASIELAQKVANEMAGIRVTSSRGK
jgi:hypothetical protein